MKKSRKIIDAHCHVASTDHIPKSFVNGVAANLVCGLEAQGVSLSKQRVHELYEQQLADPMCDQLVAEMNLAKISESVLLAVDFTYVQRDCPLTIEETLFSHKRILEKHGSKFKVFAGVDPRWGKDGIALFEKFVSEHGFSGFKVYPPCGFSPSDKGLYPFYEICNAHKIPVLIHIGATSPALSFEYASPLLVDPAAKDFPEVNFILAHASVSYTEECIMMATFRPNIFLDISGYQSTLRNSPQNNAVLNLVNKGINHKILFATDWPVFRGQGGQRSFVDAVMRTGGPLSALSERDKDLVMSGNISRILGRRI